ncbi:hypothetical protein Emag_007704 [Eimeria magna]
MGPGRASLREFFSGVYRTGRALLGPAVAASVPLRLVAVPAPSREQDEAARPAEPGSVSSPPVASDTIEPPPPLPAPTLTVGVRSPADDASPAEDSSGGGFSAELSGVEQPGAQRPVLIHEC